MANTVKKIKTEWDLSVFYKSINDPQIEKDIVEAEKAFASFANKYTKDKSYLKDPKKLRRALDESEKLSDLKFGNTGNYLSKKFDLDAGNKDIPARLNLLSQRLSKIGNSVLFFHVGISKISKSLHNKFINDPSLLPYKYMLQKVFENAKHVLSEPEEKILNLKSLPAHSLWTKSLKKVRDVLTVKHKGKEMPLSEAASLVETLKTQKERIKLYDKILEKNISVSEIAESELNAIVLNKKIDDELRGFAESYDETLLAYEDRKETVLSLVKAVNEHFYIANKFYKIKAKMLRLKKLDYADRNALVGKTNKEITFEEGYEILREVFGKLDNRFVEILDMFVKNGQVDVYPKIGKRGGAYSSGGYKVPTFTFLNYTNNLDSLMTFAHELGHGIHTELTKSLPSYYQNYSISTAEVASTLFENFVFHDQFEKLTDKEKIIALHDKISDDMGTIFVQIALFNFEVELHKTIKEKGNMTKEEMAKLMSEQMKKCFGDVMNITERNGYAFVGWPHIRYFFYVYTYAMGKITSKALYKKYNEDKSYIEKIIKFMSLGGSMSPEDIFKSIGIDTRNPEFWTLGLKNIEEDVNLLEKLVNKK